MFHVKKGESKVNPWTTDQTESKKVIPKESPELSDNTSHVKTGTS